MKCNTLYEENHKYIVTQFCVYMIFVPWPVFLKEEECKREDLEHEMSVIIIKTQCSCGAFQLHKITFW